MSFKDQQAVACVKCPKCKAERESKCNTKTGRCHKARLEACRVFIAQAYCANEHVFGGTCGTENCPYCG